MERGYVYIMTNPCLDGWVKIGMTTKSIESRLKELNRPTNIPLSFRCYASYKVDDPQEVEKTIHNLIDRLNSSLHAREFLNDGRIRKREFFKISPETAYGVFEDIAKLRNDKSNLILYPPTQYEADEESSNNVSTTSLNTTFKMLHIKTNSTIYFVFDESITATVADEKNKIICNGKIGTVSGIAKDILIKNFQWATNTNVNGWRYFKINGISLYDKRKQILNSNE